MVIIASFNLFICIMTIDLCFFKYKIPLPIYKKRNLFNSLLKPNYFKKLSYLHGVLSRLKFSFSEKATTFWKNLPLVLTLLSKDSCFVKTGGRFFQILWPSYNVWTLVSCIWDMELVSLVLHCHFGPVFGNWTWWRRTLLLKIIWL